MAGSRRLSQAIAEGDGISLIARVASPEEARAAEEAGAEGLALSTALPELRQATMLPILWVGDAPPATAREGGADAWVATVALDEDRIEELHAQVAELGLEPVVEVRDEEELELALERIDPEIFLLAGTGEEDDEPLDHVLALLPDLPAGKLAIAEVEVGDREAVLALERAGIDALLVDAARVGELVGGVPPEV